MTREEALKTWLPIISMSIDNMPELKEAFDMAIKALEQEPKSECEHDHEILKAYSDGGQDTLGKIRAEIEKAVWEDTIISRDGTEEVRIPRLDPDDVFEIIDKYKAEGSDEG